MTGRRGRTAIRPVAWRPCVWLFDPGRVAAAQARWATRAKDWSRGLLATVRLIGAPARAQWLTARNRHILDPDDPCTRAVAIVGPRLGNLPGSFR